MQYSVKSTVDAVKIHRLWLLKLLLAIQLGFLGYLLFTAIHDGHYFLAHEDEVINVCSAKVFSETGSLRAEGCIAEDVSRIGQMNWYGPGYSVLYGSLRSLLGDAPVLFIHLNILFAILSLVLIWFLPTGIENKLLIGNTLVLTQVYRAYIFTYFPESFHFLLACVLILLLVSINESEGKREQRVLSLVFIVLIVLAILFRVTYVFWLAALIGLSVNRSKAIRMTVLFAALLAVTLLYMKFFTAPPYAGEMAKIDQLYQFNFLYFIVKTAKALLRNSFYLLISGDVSVYFTIVLFIGAVVQWWKTRDRFLLAGVLVSFLLLASLMAFYSSGPWYFLKQSASLVPLLIVGLIRSEMAAGLKYGVLVMSFVVFALSENQLRQNIAKHRQAYVKFEEYRPFREALDQLRHKITGSKPVTVLWCYDEFDFGGATESLLPFSTEEGAPILYTSNVLSADSLPAVKFRMHGKLTINYLLSRHPVSLPVTTEIYTTPYFHFYKMGEE